LRNPPDTESLERRCDDLIAHRRVRSDITIHVNRGDTQSLCFLGDDGTRITETEKETTTVSGQRVIERCDVSKQPRRAPCARSIEQQRIDHVERRHAAMTSGCCRPCWIVLEAKIPTKPDQSRGRGHGGQAIGRPKGTVVQRSRNASATSHAPMSGPLS